MNRTEVVAVLGAFLWISSACSTQEIGFERDGQDYTEIIRQNYEVNPGGTLTADAEVGTILISSTVNNEVDVLVRKRLRTSDADRARKDFNNVQVKFSKTFNEVRIEVDQIKNVTYKRWFWQDWPERLHVDIEVTVPMEFNLDLSTITGDIQTGDIVGDVTARTLSGNITTGPIEGYLSLKTNSGNIETNPVLGKVQTVTLTGNNEIGPVNGEVSVRSNSGKIETRTVEGDLHAKSLTGHIKIGSVEGDATVGSNSGKIEVRTVEGDLHAKTLSGHIKIGFVEGDATVGSNSGDIQTGYVQGKLKTSTLSGNIESINHTR